MGNRRPKIRLRHRQQVQILGKAPRRRWLAAADIDPGQSRAIDTAFRELFVPYVHQGESECVGEIDISTLFAPGGAADDIYLNVESDEIPNFYPDHQRTSLTLQLPVCTADRR